MITQERSHLLMNQLLDCRTLFSAFQCGIYKLLPGSHKPTNRDERSLGPSSNRKFSTCSRRNATKN